MKNIVIILAHPCHGEKSFCAALAKSYEDGARNAGHTVYFIDIGKIDIPYLECRSNYDDPGLTPALATAQNKLKAATHWVIIYPLWLGCMPAKLKSFLEWVLSPGFAYDEDNGSTVLSRRKLQGKSAHIVMTMGMPRWIYRFYFRAHSLKTLEKGILRFCGVAPIRATLYGSVERVSVQTRRRWLSQMEYYGENGM